MSKPETKTLEELREEYYLAKEKYEQYQYLNTMKKMASRQIYLGLYKSLMSIYA